MMRKPWSATRKMVVAVCLCLAAGACTHGDGTGDASLERSVATPQARMLALAPEHGTHRQPLVSLPAEAGRVTSVRNRDYVDGLRQDIALGHGPAARIENGISVLARTSREPTLEERTPLAQPTEAGIRSEIGAQFPHIGMQVADRASSNAYGPYGLALGRAGGDVRCIYMWQWIDANRLPRDADIQGPVSVRVRLCQAATTFDAMAALVDHLSIGAPADGSGGAPIQLVDTGAVAGVDGGHGHAARRKLAAHHRHHEIARDPGDGAVANDAVPLAGPPILPASANLPAPPSPSFSDLPPQALLGPGAAAKSY